MQHWDTKTVDFHDLINYIAEKLNSDYSTIYRAMFDLFNNDIPNDGYLKLMIGETYTFMYEDHEMNKKMVDIVREFFDFTDDDYILISK